MTRLNLNDLLGLSENEAEAVIVRHGFVSRLTSKDGEVFFGTCDVRPDRVNLAIENDKVIQARIG